MLSFGKLATKLFGSTHDRHIKSLMPKVEKINALEQSYSQLSDEDLRQKTTQFRAQLQQGASLDSLLVPAFATAREAAKRVFGMRPFDVQLLGGMVLHARGIAEMRTGEGKTLMATLPVYLNALEGKGVHVVTVNDYLASRDAAHMGKLYDFLGLTTGVIIHDMAPEARRQAYACDVTYGTNNELGFDYLRDNMAFDLEQMVQRGHHFAIIDEVDSILIDEARTPLIISGAIEDRTDFYTEIDALIPHLTAEDYEIDEKQKTATFTEIGTDKLEKILKEAGHLKGHALYDAENIAVVHHINSALRAHKLFSRDRDYIVMRDEIIIIDEFTGRMMPGRRFSEGLHQALEAKEHVTIQPENQTLASITFQNYFRMYNKLAGMTGTALTEAEEFNNIYQLEVVAIPTNLPIQRKDEEDEIYRTAEEKQHAIIKEIKEAQAKGQPVLVGTTSIEKSEALARKLKKEGIKKFQVLNARYHEQEAYIIGQAGVPHAVTIATNMAGRGTDIQLGGNLEMRLEQELKDVPEGPEYDKKSEAIKAEVAALKEKALQAGGLYVLATERHESRRIDNQLRGRSGRQGDPGKSKFFLSLEDDLMRIFGSTRMDTVLQKFGIKEGEAITHPWISKALEKAQKKVEARNFEIRKNILQYDDVMNEQRKVIFRQRTEILHKDNVHDIILEMRDDTIESLIDHYIPRESYREKWDIAGLQEILTKDFNLSLPLEEWANEEGMREEEIFLRICKAIEKHTAEQEEKFTSDTMRYLEKMLLLETLDTLWRHHLLNLEHLRSAVGFRGYAQRDPLSEYKTESFELFQTMLQELRYDVTSKLLSLEEAQPPSAMTINLGELHAQHPHLDAEEQDFLAPLLDNEPLRPLTPAHVPPEKRDAKDPTTWGKLGRNEPCPCGSGKKYKHCHGAFT